MAHRAMRNHLHVLFRDVRNVTKTLMELNIIRRMVIKKTESKLYQIHHVHIIAKIYCRINFFKTKIFSYVILKWLQHVTAPLLIYFTYKTKIVQCRKFCDVYENVTSLLQANVFPHHYTTNFARFYTFFREGVYYLQQQNIYKTSKQLRHSKWF